MCKKKKEHIATYQYSDNFKRLFPFTGFSSSETVRKLKFPIRTKFLHKSVLTSKKWIKIWDYIWPLHLSLPGGSVQTDFPSCISQWYLQSLLNLLSNSFCLVSLSLPYPKFIIVYMLRAMVDGAVSLSDSKQGILMTASPTSWSLYKIYFDKSFPSRSKTTDSVWWLVVTLS